MQSGEPAAKALIRYGPRRSDIDIGNPLKYSANIVPYTQVDLAFKSNGYVESVLQVPSASGDAATSTRETGSRRVLCSRW